jgi:hypothetical protein
VQIIGFSAHELRIAGRSGLVRLLRCNRDRNAHGIHARNECLRASLDIIESGNELLAL